MFSKSIRSKIVFWYMVILAIVLLLFSALVYLNLRKTLYDDFNNLLKLKAEGVVNSIETYWGLEKQEGLRHGASAAVFTKINNLNFVKIVKRWVKEESADPELLGIVVNIFGPDGGNIASSRGGSGATYTFIENPDVFSQGHSRFDNFLFKENLSGKTVLMRFFSIPVIENNRLAYIVQAASPFTPFQSALNKLRFILFLLFPLGVVLSGISGLFLANLIIMPLKNIIGTVRRITAENLKLRIDIPDTKDEISKLVDTFNAMLEKLDVSFTSQKQLIQDISHELRTPLTIIRGEMEVALKKTRSAQEYKDVLESGLEEIGRLSLIVENLLVLSRFDSQEIVLDIKPIQLSRFLNDIVSDARILAQGKRIAISCNGEDSVSVSADAFQLRRVFLNIIDNAIKYTQPGGKISVNVKKIDNAAQVKISDNGIGISRKNLPFIFDRFFRGDKSRSSEGFGLGLSITKAIIDAHRSSMVIESEPGKGTEVIVTLPD